MRPQYEQNSPQAHSSENTPLPFDAKTSFATDFLNQYNEVKMAFEMAAAMPEIFDDFKHWAPKSYVDYFKASECRDKEAIIQAFQSLPLEQQASFNAVVESTNQSCSAALSEILKHINTMDSATFAKECEAMLDRINTGLDQIKQAMNGQQTVLDQSAIDDLFAA